jgi:ATP-dependent RNA helicase SUPV3L1/SUV3
MTTFFPGRVRAVLGPTNTGKTHLAIDRMLGHATGMIGFPLRLLARENYDRVVSLKGTRSVALITGEEKIIPPNPRWFICTVESMPVDRPVAFLAIDEIQLCADPERGHVFTDRLLHARGTDETMFLGADTVRALIKRLVPDVEIETRKRFSKLSYTGPRKLGRLPRRSAVVAFSIDEVYALAESIRRQRGGTAVVLGALSPRTRNAQVAMYQAGEVDYMVATDAIGMGLNMDVDHVAFAGTRKFDGRRPRLLNRAEIGQIAGRAGRHMNDGTFGVTNDLSPFDEETVEAVETHNFESVERAYWRKTRLDFNSPKTLLKSLESPPPRPELIRARDGEDYAVLAQLIQDQDVMAVATNPAAVRLLWEVCQIPDFRKISPDQHARLVRRVYLALTDGPDLDGRLPVDWVADQISRLDATTGDIDTLTNRIAHIRTWTYISHRGDWLADNVHWQERTRAIEDKLSDTLHLKLTQRFVDHRAALIDRRREDGSQLLSAVTAGHEVVVEGERVGSMAGMAFVPEAGLEQRRTVLAAARRAVAQELPRRAARIAADDDGSFTLSDGARLAWRGVDVARLSAGRGLLHPGVEVLRNDIMENNAREVLRRRLEDWLGRHIRKRLKCLFTALDADLPAPARGLVFQLSECLGSQARQDVRSLIDNLGPSGRKAVAALGIRIGAQSVFFPALVKPPAVRLRTILWAVSQGKPVPEILAGATDRPVLPVARIATECWAAAGYRVFGSRALRVDQVERLSSALRRRAREGPIAEAPEMTRLAGCAGEELALVLGRLGFKPRKTSDGVVFVPKRRPGSKRRPGRKGAANEGGAQPRDGSTSPFAALEGLVPAK